MSLQKETGLWKALGFGVGPVGMGMVMGYGIWVGPVARASSVGVAPGRSAVPAMPTCFFQPPGSGAGLEWNQDYVRMLSSCLHQCRLHSIVALGYGLWVMGYGFELQLGLGLQGSGSMTQ